jgi:hypothetical protein
MEAEKEVVEVVELTALELDMIGGGTIVLVFQ